MAGGHFRFSCRLPWPHCLLTLEVACGVKVQDSSRWEGRFLCSACRGALCAPGSHRQCAPRAEGLGHGGQAPPRPERGGHAESRCNNAGGATGCSFTAGLHFMLTVRGGRQQSDHGGGREAKIAVVTLCCQLRKCWHVQEDMYHRVSCSKSDTRQQQQQLRSESAPQLIVASWRSGSHLREGPGHL